MPRPEVPRCATGVESATFSSHDREELRRFREILPLAHARRIAGDPTGLLATAAQALYPGEDVGLGSKLGEA